MPPETFQVEQEVTYDHQDESDNRNEVSRKAVVADDKPDQKRLHKDKLLIQSYEILLVFVMIVVVVGLDWLGFLSLFFFWFAFLQLLLIVLLSFCFAIFFVCLAFFLLSFLLILVESIDQVGMLF